MLSKLRDEGDRRKPTAIGLGLGLTAQARMLDSRNKRAEARAARAAGGRRAAAAGDGPNASIPLRRAYGGALLYLGFVQLSSNDEEAAVKTLEAAREAFRSIDGLKLDDLPSAVAYAEASAWEVNALQSLGRLDETRRVAEEAMRVAGQVLERRPGQHGRAARSRPAVDTLSGAEGDDLHTRKALALVRQSRPTGKPW